MVKVLSKNTVKCGCGSLLGNSATDIVEAIQCPECNQLVRIEKPLAAQLHDISNMSWDSIVETIKGMGEKIFALGLTKEITLKNGEKYLVQIAHREDGVIMGFRDLYGDDKNGGMEISKKNGFSDDYTKSDLRKWLNNEFFNLLPDDLQKVIVPSKIVVGNKTVEDKVFIPSEFEIFGKCEYGIVEEGEQLELFKDWHNRVSGYSDGEYGRCYWTRTTAKASAHYFCCCHGDGYAGYFYAYRTYGVRPLFKIV